MWIIFRYVKSEFQNLDKHIYDVVEDEDILEFRDYLGAGKKSDINQDVYFLQEFFESKAGVRFYARKYVSFTTLCTTRTHPVGSMVPDTPLVSKSPAWVLRNPCNTGR